MEHLHTTICALATPPGEGGIATVRVSGPDVYGIVGKIFAPVRQGKSVADAKGYTAMLGHYLLHGAEMDECVALFVRAPHSSTGEAVIELSVNGGTAMAQHRARAVAGDQRIQRGLLLGQRPDKRRVGQLGHVLLGVIDPGLSLIHI